MEKLSRKDQILQVLVSMLESSLGEAITTANLAKQVGVSEAALYRHFPSKFKMFEGLIDYMDETVFSRIKKIMEEESAVTVRCEKICLLVLTFAEKNPGLSRLLFGDVLLGERDLLRHRTAQFYERISLQMRQAMRDAVLQEDRQFSCSPSVLASLLTALIEGRVSQYVRSGFKVMPTQHWKEQWNALDQGLFAQKVSVF